MCLLILTPDLCTTAWCALKWGKEVVWIELKFAADCSLSGSVRRLKFRDACAALRNVCLPCRSHFKTVSVLVINRTFRWPVRSVRHHSNPIHPLWPPPLTEGLDSSAALWWVRCRLITASIPLACSVFSVWLSVSDLPLTLITCWLQGRSVRPATSHCHCSAVVKQSTARHPSSLFLHILDLFPSKP